MSASHIFDTNDPNCRNIIGRGNMYPKRKIMINGPSGGKSPTRWTEEYLSQLHYTLDLKAKQTPKLIVRMLS
jgi:hypothetical protein